MTRESKPSDALLQAAENLVEAYNQEAQSRQQKEAALLKMLSRGTSAEPREERYSRKRYSR